MNYLITPTASLLKAADSDGRAAYGRSYSATADSNENEAIFYCWRTFRDDINNAKLETYRLNMRLNSSSLSSVKQTELSYCLVWTWNLVSSPWGQQKDSGCSRIGRWGDLLYLLLAKYIRAIKLWGKRRDSHLAHNGATKMHTKCCA
jgi:hypothetical protein